MNIEQLTQQIIKPFLLEEEGIKIGLIGGSFRPPHKGHFELIKKAAGENTHVFIIASDSDTADQDRNFSSEISEKIWDIYLTKLPNVKYINAQVPVSVVYEIVNILNNDKYTISPNKKTGVIKPASPISEEIASQIKKLGTKFNINVYVGDAADTKSYKQFTDMPERYTNKNVTNVKINTMGRVEGLKAEYLRVALQNGEFDRISDFLPTELNPNEKEQSIELMKKGRLAEMYWPQVSNIKSSDGKNPILDLVLELNPEALKYFRENTGAEIFLTFSGETAIKVKRIGTALGGKVQLDIINRGSVPTDKPEQVIEIKDDNYDKWLEKFYSNNNWIKSMLNTVNESVIIEGGNAFVGTQRINKADIKPTIEWLEGLTKLPLSNNMIGSTGIKDSSSDLDLAVDINTTSKEQLYTTLFNWCVTNDLNPKENVKKSGVSVHFKTPINGDIQYGFVQTDFMFNSDTEFFKFALVAHSSKYSGKDRQVVLSNLAKAAGCKWSSANGLTDRITNEPIPGGKDPIQIAKKLLGKDTAVPEDLHTIESIIAALEGDPKKGERLGNFQKDDVLLEGVENIDYVVCNECNSKMIQIQYRHLLYKHNMLLSEYILKYPNSKLQSEGMKLFGDKNPMKDQNVKSNWLDIMHSEEFRNKQKIAQTGRHPNEESRKKMSINNSMNNEKNRIKVSEALKDRYKNDLDLIELRRKKFTKIRNSNEYRQRMYELNLWRRPELTPLFEQYHTKVKDLTQKSFTKHFYEIENARLRSKDNSLDHEISINYGFNNNIPPEIISHYKNLRVIPHSVNESKGAKNSISFEELIERIKTSNNVIDNRILLQCGGSGGHMQHPYDAAKTGTELIKLFNDVVSYINNESKEKPSIKIDGINAAVRYVNKEFVLDRGSAKPLDVSGIRTQDLVNRFGDGHGFIKIGEIVLKILNSANKDIQPELKKLGLLDNPKLMLNMEYVAGKTNVKDYGKNFLAIHNMLSIDFVPGAKRREAVTVDYDKSAMDSLINKVNIKAAEQQFEMTGKISAQFKSQPNLSGVLSQTINLKDNKDKPKSLSEHLNSLQIPTSKDIVEFADGTKAGALSGKVFNKILENKESLTVIFKDNNSIKLAISGFISVYATMVLGEEILKNLDSKLGAANEQEGIVIQGLLPLPLKITGKFIIDKNLTTFSK